jgi:DNA polymerase-3 subunit epsilon
MLDAMTIYKDRKPYPHKLRDAAGAYSLSDSNAHRAGDDALTTFDLLCKMGAEADDLIHYVNLFGYNPKYGIPKPKISSINYLPQGYDLRTRLYARS